MRPEDVTAVLVTRGDQEEFVERIVASLIFEDVLIWDNSKREDRKAAGRYFALLEETKGVVYFQDDDVLVPRSTQRALLDEYEPGVVVTNWAHGETPGGFEDVAFVGAGAILDADLPWIALDRYLDEFPLDEEFLYEADFVAGVLFPKFRYVHLPFEIELRIAQHPSRLCNQSFHPEAKQRITERARSIRDGVLV
jgi:hypothetical protein